MRHFFFILLLCSFLEVACSRKLVAGEERPLDEGYAAAFDWRESAVVSIPKNQMDLSSCGVFAAVSVFEAAIARTTGTLVDLAEQHFINASDNWSNETGVSPATVFEFMKENGIVLENFLPYQNRQTAQQPDHDADFRLTSWGAIEVDQMSPEHRRRTLKQALIDHGPVTTPIAFYENLDRYRGGVYEETASSPIVGGHWLTVVGWVDDEEISGGGCWICKNCWGTAWGEEGFARIAYNDASGIDNYVFLYAEYAPTVSLESVELLPPGPHGGYHPRWAPDGRKMVYTTRNANCAALGIWDPGLKSHSPLVEGLVGDLTPSWSPDF